MKYGLIHKCGERLRVAGYRAFITEDPNENFKRIPNTFWCNKCKVFVHTVMTDLKVEKNRG